MPGLHRLGTALIAVGLLAVVYGVLWQSRLLPGSQPALPRPVAHDRAVTPEAAPTPIATPADGDANLPPAHPPTTTMVAAASTVPAGLAAADASDRRESARLPRGGYAVRLAIPAINLDTPVQQAGIVYDDQGNPIWQTLPFVAVHYGDLTARVGGQGNAVLAGHVVTRTEGNVFRSLYLVDIDTRIQVWDDTQLEHDFRVVGVQLVLPDDTSPLNQTPDPTLTLITCGGTFDPRTREFSERLIVTAKPVAPD